MTTETQTTSPQDLLAAAANRHATDLQALATAMRDFPTEPSRAEVHTIVELQLAVLESSDELLSRLFAASARDATRPLSGPIERAGRQRAIIQSHALFQRRTWSSEDWRSLATKLVVWSATWRTWVTFELPMIFALRAVPARAADTRA
jgi:hypothetical protein